jgi:diguanylate cyclase (GGDEF)-like protein
MATLFAEARRAGELETPAKPMKALVAEDNPVFQTVLSTMLCRWGYDVVVAQDGLLAWQILEARDGPRLAILDWMMPGLDGVQICRRVRAASREPYVYIILLTARNDSQDLVEGMDAGADDYLTKPFQAHELRVRLRAGRRILDLQEQLVGARDALRVQATHDGLTGLFNRAAISEILQSEVARAARLRQPLSLLMVDLDRFKQINDTHGHQAGDAVLHEAAIRMKGAVRAYDSVGRYGGEEFLIVLPGCDLESACARAESVRRAVGSDGFDIGGATVRVTCSIGVSCAEDLAGDARWLAREADRALYRAKDGGRNRVESLPAFANEPRIREER